MEMAVAAPAPPDLDRRIAQRLAGLRAERGWSLDTVAERTGISRATLSRLERAELSPTAAMLNTLCALYGWTLSRLMTEAERKPAQLVPAAAQTTWTDPASGYRRRAVSPPAPGLQAELVEVRLPRGAVVDFAAAPVIGLEQHLWLIEGAMTLDVGGVSHALSAGDCLRYVLTGATRFVNTAKRETRYLIAIVHP
jgi:transcriptional regulator with XRE-family HTH domain